MKLLAAALLSAFATSASAEVIHYKANFGPVEWSEYDITTEQTEHNVSPDFFKGYLSVEWTMDTTSPSHHAIDDKGFVRGIGAEQTFLMSSGLNDAFGAWKANGSDYGELWTGWFGPYKSPSVKNPSAEELRLIGMEFDGRVLGKGGYASQETLFSFSAEAKWVTTAPVPLPAGFPAFLTALGGLALWSRKRRRG